MAERMGCERCGGGEAAAFWGAWPTFGEVARVVDESHFVVRIAACPGCRQRWVSVFTETIDWADGEDPQYWAVASVTQAESEAIVAVGEAGCEAKIEAIARGRRCLRVDYPKGAEKTIRWAEGAFWIRGHD